MTDTIIIVIMNNVIAWALMPRSMYPGAAAIACRKT